MIETFDYYKSFFDEHGYVVVDNAFLMEDLITFKKNLDSLIRLCIKRASTSHSFLLPTELSAINLDLGIKLLDAIDPAYVSFIQRTISRSSEFLEFCSNRKIRDLIKFLLEMPGELPLYLTSNGVVFTNPYDEEVKTTNFNIDWHLDTFYTIPKSRFIQWWMPLYHNAVEEIGTLMVCPGSNKVNPYEVKQIFDPSLDYNNQYYVEKDEVEKYNPISVEVKLGQILIFDGKTIHRSGINQSKNVRCTMLGLCHHVAKDDFIPITAPYKYHGLTPEAHFAEIYGDEQARKRAYDHAASNKPLGGI